MQFSAATNLEQKSSYPTVQVVDVPEGNVESTLTNEVAFLASLSAQEPYRCTVLRMKVDKHAILLLMHCTLLKSCSVDDFLGELAILYSFAVRGEQHTFQFRSLKTPRTVHQSTGALVLLNNYIVEI